MSTSVLPPLAARQQVEARIQDLVDAVEAHPKMQPPNRHPTLHHVWDFAMRSKYILSELDNIEGGFAVEHPEQIKDYNEGKFSFSFPCTTQCKICMKNEQWLKLKRDM
jgi:hypothetical protein